MKRIVVDVTQLVHCQGELTGIPRVIDELSTRFAKDPKAIFVTWDKNSDSYLQVDLMATREIRGQGICYINQDGSVHDPLTRSKSFVNKTASSNRVLAAKAARGLKRAYRQLKKANTPASFKKVRPAKDDLIFIGWGEWHDPTFIAAITGAAAQGAKVVQVVHDMLPLNSPQLAGSGNAAETMGIYNKKVLPICNLILVVSKNTQKDVQEWLKANKLHVPPIGVIRNGDLLSASEPKMPHEATFQNGVGSNGKYILCVATIEARKNHTLLYYVWKLAASKGINLPKLIMVGRRGWRTEDIYAIITEDPVVKDQMVFLHEVSDTELEWLYGHCLFSVQPSIYEGWGIPIAEAARRGVPVAASGTSSIPEVAGDLVTYFNPFSTDECLSAILKLCEPNEAKKAKELLVKYKPTSWDDTFEQVRDYLKEYL